MDFRDAVCQKNGWGKLGLYYDERMVGSETEQDHYRRRIDLDSQTPKWRPLEDAATFKLLLDIHLDPMWIHIEVSGVIDY